MRATDPGGARMRGSDEQTSGMFSYLSPEQRLRPDHPLYAIRQMIDRVLAQLSPQFTAIYSRVGRASRRPGVQRRCWC